MPLEDIRENRIKKKEEMEKLKLNPYPSQVKRTYTIQEALDKFIILEKAQQQVSLVGRIRSIREHGKIIFIHFEDETNKIQALFHQETLGEKYVVFKKFFDVGDFIEIQGVMFKTQRGEITLRVENYKMLTKTIRPLPEKWHGLSDVETKLRQRYLDFIINPEEKEVFKKKAIFWKAIRQFLDAKGFIEVDTAALEVVPGGADARPFITHYNALDTDFYLRISLELPLKKFIISGFEKVYEIGKIFRNEGMSSEHLQDYLQLEFYWAYADYHKLMEFLEEMYKDVIEKTTGSLQTKHHGQIIDWSKKWSKKDYYNLFQQEIGIDIANTTKEELYNYLCKDKEQVDKNLGIGRMIDLIFKKKIRKKLIEPMFLINHPKSISPLAKKREENGSQVERFNIIAGGTELGNGFSELNDPLDQEARFEEQAQLREAGDEEAQMMDRDFVIALEYGMPPTAGFGLSERFFAFLMDRSIRETVFMPPMRPINKN
jgi:lysyl-tRNA synthetase class 2